MKIGNKSAVEISKEFTSSSLCARSLDAEEIINLTDEDDEGDARGKTADDRRGDKGDEPPEAHETNDEQQCTREQARDPNTFKAITTDKHDQHCRHRTGGSADLKRRAGEQTHNNAGKNRSDQPRRSRRARGDPKRQR